MFSKIVETRQTSDVQVWLLAQKWYGAASDNEHFVRFWQANFNENPNFRQNYIVPNFLSIVNSLQYGSGIAIVPDFLCREALSSKQVQLLWQGFQKISNKIFFAYRKNSIYQKQIDELFSLFSAQGS